MHIVECPFVPVAEIETVLGTDLCDALRVVGHLVAGPVATVADAYLSRGKPGFAGIECRPGYGRRAWTMDLLHRRGAPFDVHANHDSQDSCDEEVAGTPWLAKPVLPWDPVIVLNDLTIGRA